VYSESATASIREALYAVAYGYESLREERRQWTQTNPSI
jgi:hypothetical protein